MFKPAHELVQEAKKSVKECDVREPNEYRQGHIAGSVNIPRGLLEFKISNEPALQNLTRPIIVYCKTSGRAALSVVAMQSMGFQSITSLAGGFDAWVAEGHPVVQPNLVSFE